MRKSGDRGGVCVWRVAESTWGSKNVDEGRKLKIQEGGERETVLKKRIDLDFFLVRVVLSVWGDEVEKQGLVLSGVMFNYKISPASRTIFLAVLQARIFLIKKN